MPDAPALSVAAREDLERALPGVWTSEHIQRAYIAGRDSLTARLREAIRARNKAEHDAAVAQARADTAERERDEYRDKSERSDENAYDAQRTVEQLRQELREAKREGRPDRSDPR